MSYKSKSSGFKRIKWNNKSTNQKQELLKNHYSNLGYQIPNYLSGKKLTDKQLQGAINKINRGYNHKIKPVATKPKPTKPKGGRKQKNKNQLLKDLDKAIVNHNKQVRKTIKHFKEKTTYSPKAIEYLSGYGITTTVTNAMIYKENKALTFENLQFNKNFFATDNKYIEEEIKRIKNETNLKKVSNYQDYLEDSKKDSLSFMEDFLNDDFLEEIDSETKGWLYSKFEKLNSVQMDLAVKSSLEELRDRYLKMLENGEIEEGKAVEIIERINRIIDSIVEEI